jgi:N-acetyl-anhydromuramoyl-L-alanine amidase
MRFRENSRLSPNHDSRSAHECLGVLFHHSVMGFEETIAWMLRDESQVSYHCLIASDGTRCTLVPDQHIAWHAGASAFLGRTRCNDFLLGLAFAGDTYRAPLTENQLASAVEWLEMRWRRYHWTLERMTDHRQVAPERKNDLNPGEWERLRARLLAEFEG